MRRRPLPVRRLVSPRGFAALPALLLSASALASVLGTVPTAGLEAGAGAPAAASTSSSQPVLGVDVSHHSGEVDWAQVVADGYAFAYLKATEGVDAADPMFDQHWARLAELDVPRGAYHFYVTEDDPEEQARFFLSRVDHRSGDLVPVVDVELLGHGTQPGLPDRVRHFLDVVEAELGVRPMVYTQPNFWDAHLGDGFGDHPLWVAETGVAEPRMPQGFHTWHLWQFQQDRDVAGVEKGADVSRLHPQVTLDDLRITLPNRPPGGTSESP